MTANETRPKKDLLWVVNLEKASREEITEYLKIQGYRVVEISDCTSLIDKLATNIPDAIIFGLDDSEKEGLKICRTIKGNPETSRIPVVFITSSTDRNLRLKAAVSGANDTIVKPLDLQYLVLRVRNAVNIKKLYDELRESYRRLQELEALKQSLVQMIVHDFRTPLQTTSMALEMARANWVPEEKRPEYIMQAEKSNDQILHLVNDLLDVGKMEEGKMTLVKSEVDLGQIVEKIGFSLSMLARKKNIDLEIHTQPVRIDAEEKLIERVIENLLTNAVKYTPEDGSVAVRVYEKDGRAHFEVQDTGDGIAEEDKQTIFEKFGQVKARQKHRKYSTGLGLTFCKMVVEEHGGIIGVESQIGHGSLFWFDLDCV